MSSRNRIFHRIKYPLRIGKPSRPGSQIPSSGTSEQAAEQPEVVEQPAIVAEENLPAFPQPPETEPAPDNKSPIWLQSMQHFAQDQPELYKLIQDRIGEIREVDVDNWDTWLNIESRARLWMECEEHGVAAMPPIMCSSHIGSNDLSQSPFVAETHFK
jgi:hypothetical protein